MEGDSVNACYLQRVSYFNPLPPHGGRPVHFQKPGFDRHISIHSLRMEGDMGSR